MSRDQRPKRQILLPMKHHQRRKATLVRGKSSKGRTSSRLAQLQYQGARVNISDKCDSSYSSGIIHDNTFTFGFTLIP